MYADNTLTPKEAVRLCALGTLTSGPVKYSKLSKAIRHFISHITGPSLEVMGTSLELLKYEGLVTSVNGEGIDDAVLTITESGSAELRSLLTANVRNQASDMNKLIVALKFRFLHLLNDKDQRAQADILIEAQETELARLEELHRQHNDDLGHLLSWLNQDIKSMLAHLEWLKNFKKSLY